MKTKSAIKKIKDYFHVHSWQTSGVNGYYVPCEKQCEKCGKYRHRILDPEKLYKTPEWVDGKHPKNKTLGLKEG